jgi:dipeptidyl aminopeptidase/acylaminoacyl peptidase
LTHSEGQVLSVYASKSTIVFTRESALDPTELYAIGWDGSNEREITRINRDWWESRRRPHVKYRTFNVGEDSIDAWLLLPAEEGSHQKPYPLLVDSHGGPHSFSELGYSYHSYWYTLLSNGWAVLAPNTRGSSSYGKDFAESLRGHWGEMDLPQIENLVEQLQDEGIASKKVAIAGKSYGGFMAAYAAGHSDKFCGAIISAPVANLESHSGTSDSGFYVGPYDMGGELSEKREVFHRLSPIQDIHKASASILILHGEKDERCPLGQSEEIFASLMREGKTKVEMIVYPEGHHSMAESGTPSHRVDYSRRIVNWCMDLPEKPAPLNL